MTDETRVEESATGVDDQAKVINAPLEEEKEDQEPEEQKLRQAVEISDIGPCKKHIKVSIERGDIEHRLNDKFSELVKDAVVPGFRPGKAPRKIIERRFLSEVSDQVKAELLFASLEQLAKDHDIAPLSAPNLNPNQIQLPKDGPFVYEFEVEVRPHFDLPAYKGLRLKRPVKTFTDEDVSREERRILAPYSQVAPKPDGHAQQGDVLVVDMTTYDGDRELSSLKEVSIDIEARLAFKDGVAPRFAEQVQGANSGDTRTVDIQLSSAVADSALRGKTVQAKLTVKDVKTRLMPELTHEFLHNFGVHTPEQMRELIHVALQRRLEYAQRRSAREQVLSQILAASTWELPEDLLMRQARNAMGRRLMEMRADGISEEEIRGQRRLLEQNILRSTAQSLKEHFVLQKIAEVEEIDIDEEDLDGEIERMAEQTDESPRRIRARIEKDGLTDALAAEIIERRVMDLILNSAEYDDVPLDEEQQATVSTVEEQAVPGELQDPTAPPAPEPTAEQSSSEAQS